MRAALSLCSSTPRSLLTVSSGPEGSCWARIGSGWLKGECTQMQGSKCWSHMCRHADCTQCHVAFGTRVGVCACRIMSCREDREVFVQCFLLCHPSCPWCSNFTCWLDWKRQVVSLLTIASSRQLHYHFSLFLLVHNTFSMLAYKKTSKFSQHICYYVIYPFPVKMHPSLNYGKSEQWFD